MPREVTDSSGDFFCALLLKKTLQMMVIPGQYFFLNGSENSRAHRAVFMPWAWELQQTKSCGAGVLGDNSFVSDLERMTHSWKISEMQM